MSAQTWYCDHCGSRDIRHDAVVRFDPAKQIYHVIARLQNVWCESCSTDHDDTGKPTFGVPTPPKLRDPLDLAFVAIGVGTAFRELGPTDDIGQLELVGDVLALAPELDRHHNIHFPQGYAGCWAYEVAEAFGEWCARLMLAGKTVSITDVQSWLEVNITAPERQAA